MRTYDLLIFGYLFAAAIVLGWGLWGYWHRKTSARWYRFTNTLVIIVGLLFIDALVIEPNWIAVEQVAVSDAKLAEVLSGITVVQISDLHVREVPGIRENSLVDKVNALNPDLILITGDILEKIDEIQTAKSVLKSLKSRCGIFAVLGNTDYRLWRFGMDRLVGELGKEGVVFLKNENLAVPLPNGKTLRLAGVNDSESKRVNLSKTLAGIPAGEPVLLMAHSPEIYAKAILAEVNLLLVGHTHGGQVGIPWLIRRSEYANRSSHMSGIVRDGKTTMYVNRGIGTKTLPIRLFCRPEISVFQFVK